MQINENKEEEEEFKPLGAGLKKLTTGIATGFVMLVVSALIIKAQGVFSGFTLSLLLTLAVIYAFREIFKEDISNALWKALQKGRPRWGRILRDTTSRAVIGRGDGVCWMIGEGYKSRTRSHRVCWVI